MENNTSQTCGCQRRPVEKGLREETTVPAWDYGAPQVAVLAGPVGTGKTQALVERVRAALAAGADAPEVLVLAASAPAADELAVRLGVPGVRVTTPLTLARGLLACDGAAAALDGRTHMLCGFEENFFLEDMRVTGEKQRRLREMLKFLQRGWSEMREDEEGWLVTGEEVALNDFARSRLRFMGALVPAEVTAACVRWLRADAAALAGQRRRFVFADDFRAMSRASQRLCRLLAGERLTVCWSTLAGLRGEEPYGYAEGLDELEEAARAAGSGFDRAVFGASRQAQAPARATADVHRQECLVDDRVEAPRIDEAAPAGTFAVETAGELGDEMDQVVHAVRGLLREGGIAPGEVFVAAPTDAWVRRATAALRAAGVPVGAVEERQALGGDIRDLAKCGPAAVYTALHLAADPASATAWRCWCGFGDWLTCSAGVSGLAEEAARSGATACELLERLAAGDDAAASIDARKLAARYRAGRALLEQVADLRGMELLEALVGAVAHAAGEAGAGAGGPAVPAALLDLVGEVGPDETAAALYARAERALTAPRFAAGSVRVGGWDALLGLAPRAVVLCGCVNGLMPPLEYFDLSLATIDEQDRMHRRLVERLAQVAGKARDALVCSTFERAGIVESETLRLKTERVRLRDGRRVCDLGPSVVVQYLSGARHGRER